MGTFKAKFVPNKTVNQLIILYILEKMEIPLTETSLLDICTNQRDYLNYMDFKDVMANLLEFKFISKTLDNENENRFKLTDMGFNCLSHFYTKIPNSIREDINNFAQDNKVSFKRNQEYYSKYKKNDDNTYTAIFRIISPLEASTLFEIKIQYNSRQAAMDACKKWKDNATKIYAFTFENLGD